MRTLRDGVRLAVGTFTVLPVRAPDRVDRRVAALAMLLGPALGAGLALMSSAVLLAIRWLDGGSYPLLPAALALGTAALLTRGLHLDGLADLADGLGVRRSRDEALAAMKRPDIGAFGTVTLIFVVLTQVFAVAAATIEGRGAAALIIAFVTGRGAMAMACVRGIPSARPEGLGAAVAGSVPRSAATGLFAVIWVGAVVIGSLAGEAGAVRAAIAVLAGVLASALVVARSVRRFGGITGDVLGGAGEIAATAVLVVMATSPGQ